MSHWKEAQKLRGELLVDHINVRVKATDKPHPATLSLLAGAALAPEDLSLDLTLQYMRHEDTTIVEVHTTKRKLATEAEANGTDKRSGSGGRSKAAKPKAGREKSKPKHIDADDEDDDDGKSASGSQPPPKIKRERRSISQGGGVDKQSSASNDRKRSNSSSRRLVPMQYHVSKRNQRLLLYSQEFHGQLCRVQGCPSLRPISHASKSFQQFHFGVSHRILFIVKSIFG